MYIITYIIKNNNNFLNIIMPIKKIDLSTYLNPLSYVDKSIFNIQII